jgi:hypothetical protein
MTTTLVHCDRCLERIESGRFVVRLETGPSRHEGSIDLCDRCMRAFLDWLKAGAGEATLPSEQRDRLEELIRTAYARQRDGETA